MRGTVSGILWGFVIGGVSLGLASQVGELPAGVSSQAVDTAPQAEPDAPPVAEAATPDVEVAATPQAETIALPTEDDEPPAIPEASVVLPDASAGADVVPPAIALTPDALNSPISPVVDQPELAADPESEIDAQSTVPAPGVTTQSLAEVDPNPESVPARADIPQANDAPVAVVEAVPTLQVPEEENTAVLDVPATQPATIPEQAEPTVIENAPRTAEPAAEPVVAPQVADTPSEPEVETAQAEQAPLPAPVILPDTEEGPSVDPVAQSPLTPEVTPAQPSGAGVRVNRLGAEPSLPAGQEAEVVPEEEVADDAPALVRFATPFDNPEGLPLLSLILVDDADIATGPGQVADLGFPVTVILNPLAPDAADRMAAYRAAGVEVGLRASLPNGATPSDVEVAFEAAFAAVPDAVVLFSDGNDGVQRDRSVTEQVVRVLAADGRGLVTVQRGLGNALRIAEQAAVPAASVLRDLDGDGQTAAAVVRALDQAAFRARQSGDAVLLAKVGDDTLGALATWGAKIGNEQLLLAPVSAVLNGPMPIE